MRLVVLMGIHEYRSRCLWGYRCNALMRLNVLVCIPEYCTHEACLLAVLVGIPMYHTHEA